MVGSRRCTRTGGRSRGWCARRTSSSARCWSPGRSTPRVVTADMVASMPERSVVVDISIDQGGCLETSRMTTHDDPTYVEHGVVHYAWATCPVRCPPPRRRRWRSRRFRTCSGWPTTPAAACSADPGLLAGVNVAAGQVTNDGVAEAHGLTAHPAGTCSRRGEHWAAAAGGALPRPSAGRARLAGNTVAAYRRDLEVYGRFLAEVGIDDPRVVTTDDIEAFVAWLRSSAPPRTGVPMRPSSVARIVVAVRGFHRSSPARGWWPRTSRRGGHAACGSLPAQGVVGGAGGVAAVLAPLGDDPRGLRDRAMLELLYGAGLRITELISLDVDDLDRSERLVRVHGKGDKERLVPYGEVAERALERWLVGGRPALTGATPALFVNARGDRLSRQGVWKIVGGPRRPGRARRQGVAPHAAALVRHPPPRRWRRRACGAGAARARERHHDPDLHAGQSQRAARGLRAGPPTSLNRARSADGRP
jgi:site-specific recombinase XerD